MRQIKFRGKDINGKWHYGDLLNMTEKDEETGELIKVCAIVSLGINEAMEEPREGVAVEIYKSEIAIATPFTVGQFTGLIDKNGVDIYEGDKVRAMLVYEYSYREEEGVVLFIDGCFIIDLEDEYVLPYEVDELSFQQAIEVIGNIHDK